MSVIQKECKLGNLHDSNWVSVTTPDATALSSPPINTPCKMICKLWSKPTCDLRVMRSTMYAGCSAYQGAGVESLGLFDCRPDGPYILSLRNFQNFYVIIEDCTGKSQKALGLYPKTYRTGRKVITSSQSVEPPTGLGNPRIFYQILDQTIGANGKRDMVFGRATCKKTVTIEDCTESNKYHSDFIPRTAEQVMGARNIVGRAHLWAGWVPEWVGGGKLFPMQYCRPVGSKYLCVYQLAKGRG